MARPVIRLAAAVILLAAYQRWVPAKAVTAEAMAPDHALLRNIDESEVAFSAGRYADALGPTERLTVTMPSQALYFDRLARIHHELGHSSEEARAWEGVFRTSPTPSDACPMLPQAYDRIRDPARSVDAYERCVEVDPDNPDSLLFLGRAYNAADRGGDARGVLERALQLAPQYADVHLVLGVRNFADGRVEDARSDFERFLELSPERRDEVAIWLERTSPRP